MRLNNEVIEQVQLTGSTIYVSQLMLDLKRKYKDQIHAGCKAEFYIEGLPSRTNEFKPLTGQVRK